MCFSIHKISLFILLLFSISFNLGCARPLYILDYNAQLTNSGQLKSLVDSGTEKIAFTNTIKPNARIDMECRMSDVNFKEGVNLEDYVNDAIIKELKASNIYSETSNKKLSGNIDYVSLDTTGSFTAVGALVSPSLDKLTDGKWSITMTFNGDGIEPFTIPSMYLFPVYEQGKTMADRLSDPLGPDGPCVNPHYMFKDAVANLVKILFNHPSFREFISK